MNILTFTTDFFGFGSLEKLFPIQFEISFDENKVKTNTKYQFETIINPGELEIFLFTKINNNIYRIRLYQSEEDLTGDIRMRIGYKNYHLLFIMRSKNDIKNHNLEINTINEFKEYWNELKNDKKEDGDLKSIFEKLKIEKYLSKFEEEEVTIETLLLFDEERLEKYIPKEGPRLSLLNYINQNK